LCYNLFYVQRIEWRERMSRPSGSTKRAALIALLLLVGTALVTSVIAQETPHPLQGDTSYTVQQGDILDLIGAFYDVQVDCLIEQNGLASSGVIFAGDQLIISPSCPPYDGSSDVVYPRTFEGQGGGGEFFVYVRPGDTLDVIGQRLDVSVAAVMDANGLSDSSILRSGDSLIIPAGAPPYGFYPALIGLPEGQGGGGDPNDVIYVLQPRDILDLIAAYYNVDLRCLLDANQITNPNTVRPGLTILIPGNCPAYSGMSSSRPDLIGGLQLTIETFPEAQTAPTQAATQVAPPTQQILPSPTQEIFQATATNTLIPTQAFTSTPLPVTRGPTRTPTPQQPAATEEAVG
jgi:LysM repeat protein